MKRFIQKTTSVFMSLAMVALIGAPAYATAEEKENEYEVSAEVVEYFSQEIATQSKSVRTDYEEVPPPAVCDHSEEEAEAETETEEDFYEESALEEPVEEEKTESEEEPENTEENENSGITEDEILDYIDSEEFQDALEDAEIDSEIIEDEIENGNYEIIYITQEDFEQMRKTEALSHITYSLTLLGESALILLMIPATPFLFFIPFAGPFMVGGVLGSPIIFLVSLGYAIASPVIAIFEYKNYELEPGYEIVD